LQADLSKWFDGRKVDEILIELDSETQELEEDDEENDNAETSGS